MEAEKMLKDLGYEIERDDNAYLIYIKYDEDCGHDTGSIEKIIFDKTFNRVAHTTNSYFDFIDYKELKAINQQCKELGWLDEE